MLAARQNPRVVELIKAFTSLPEDELTATLEATNLEGWQWPRSDLTFWIPVLNRFDGILETVIKSYDLRGTWSRKEKDAEGKEIKEDPAVEARRLGVQMNPFTPRTKRTVVAIFEFEKLLLENCTNRKMFASYDVSPSKRHLEQELTSPTADQRLPSYERHRCPPDNLALMHSTSATVVSAES